MKQLVLGIMLSGLFISCTASLSAGSEQKNAEQINTILTQTGSHVYAIARTATPIFYAEDFPRYFGGGTGSTLILDDWNQIDPVESVAFARSVFTVQKAIQYKTATLLQVTTAEYPYDEDPHYIDSRFVTLKINPKKTPKERKIHLLQSERIIKRMISQVGKQYVWGGNAPIGGIKKLKEFYKPENSLNTITEQKWILDGFDCSGILYWATNGYTPRNTSKLITYGTGLAIAGKTSEEIKSMLQPLDIIVWKGHNQIVIDSDHILESTANFTQIGNYSTPNGVRIVPIIEALDSIMTEGNRIPVNEYADSVPEGKKKFVIRRWYPNK